MKLYIIAGEASGDMYGGMLVEQLLKAYPNIKIRGWGGNNMIAAGAEIVKHIRELAFMGFVEVAKNMGKIRANFSYCRKDIIAFDPDMILYIDYPGFNLRMAKWSHGRGYKNYYYISPQLWAWKENRIKQIKVYIDRMLVILPFEPSFYASHGMDVDFVGHPLLEILKSKRENNLVKRKKQIALFPGSRKQEIRYMFPVFLQVIKHFPNTQFFIAKAPGVDRSFYQSYLKNSVSQVALFEDDRFDLLQNSKAAIISSGTATLEAALLRTPQVVVYKTNKISYWIGKQLVKLKYISLVNLILDKPLVKELIQDEMNEKKLRNALEQILDADQADYIQAGYAELYQKLSIPKENDAVQIILSGLLE